MDLAQEMFAIKLHEMEQQYGKLQTRLRVCGGKDQQRLREELAAAREELACNDLMLKKSMEGSRSPAEAQLAKAQWEYCSKVEKLLHGQAPQYVHSEASAPGEDQAEAAALFAEYAMDFATQAMRIALIAALQAVDLQMSLEQNKEGSPHETK